MKKILFSSLLFVASHAASFAQSKTIFCNRDGAIKGYDPVAYFNDQKPEKGSDSLTFSWHDATWHFVSASNLQLFQQNPEKYAPQYGGFCAYGWAQGYAAKIDPEAWSIVNGKLYLNYSRSVQNDWNKKRTEYIQKADKNYAESLGKN